MMPIEATRRVLTLGFLPGVGAKTLEVLAARPDFASASLEHLCASHPRTVKALQKSDALAEAERRCDAEVAKAGSLATRIISRFDADFPELLRRVPDPPVVLYVRGDLAALSRPSVAIVGTRQPTVAGREIAKRIAEYFGATGWNVVSGLAIGCDTAAHEGALQGQGVTTAVLATGADQIVPSQNIDLAHRILDGGGMLVSEYEFGASATAGQFVQRDRVQAALAAGVVVVQTDLEGGSLHACRAIIRYGRLLAYPFPTPTDIARDEPKIAGIRWLANANGAELADFLKVANDPSPQLFVIRTKEDYEALAIRLMDHVPARVRSDLP